MSTNNQITDLAAIADAPIFDASCNEFSVDGNPLDATSTDTVIPALCAEGIIVDAGALSCPQDKVCGPID